MARKAPIVDFEFLESHYAEIFGGEHVRFMSELIERFSRSAPSRLGAIRLAIHENNASLLRYEAHALKGMGLNIGGRAFADLCKTLEQLGETGQIAQADALKNDLQNEYDLLLTELLKWRETNLRQDSEDR